MFEHNILLFVGFETKMTFLQAKMTNVDPRTEKYGTLPCHDSRNKYIMSHF
jgi:hypothetical protein